MPMGAWYLSLHSVSVDFPQFGLQLLPDFIADGLDDRKKRRKDGFGFVHAGKGLVQFVALGSVQRDPAPDVVDIIAKNIAFVDDVQKVFGMHGAFLLFSLETIPPPGLTPKPISAAGSMPRKSCGCLVVSAG
jgi:hypothetical protein